MRGEFPYSYILGMPLIRKIFYDDLLGMPLIREFPYDNLLGMTLVREFLYDYFHRKFSHDNINFLPETKHFIFQQVIDKSTALSSKHLFLHAFIKVITKIFKCL